MRTCWHAPSARGQHASVLDESLSKNIHSYCHSDKLDNILAFRNCPFPILIFTKCVKYLHSAECQIYISFTLLWATAKSNIGIFNREQNSFSCLCNFFLFYFRIHISLAFFFCVFCIFDAGLISFNYHCMEEAFENKMDKLIICSQNMFPIFLYIEAINYQKTKKTK